MSNSLNVYPSTNDFPLIAGGQDLVESLLFGARRRYKRYGTADDYIAAGQVCAIGALAREAGLTPHKWGKVEEHDFTDGMEAVLLEAKIEGEMVSAAKTAMELLDEAATELYDVDGGGWSGPLEKLNQVGNNTIYKWSDRKEAVLKCYDHAIEKRRAMAVA